MMFGIDLMSIFRRRREEGSSVKDRLQLVLLHDRSDISPDTMEEMRKEMIEVIRRYLEIDETKIEFAIETEERSAALVANIPVKTMKRLKRRTSSPAEGGL